MRCARDRFLKNEQYCISFLNKHMEKPKNLCNSKLINLKNQHTTFLGKTVRKRSWLTSLQLGGGRIDSADEAGIFGVIGLVFGRHEHSVAQTGDVRRIVHHVLRMVVLNCLLAFLCVPSHSFFCKTHTSKICFSKCDQRTSKLQCTRPDALIKSPVSMASSTRDLSRSRASWNSFRILSKCWSAAAFEGLWKRTFPAFSTCGVMLAT